MKNYDLFDFLRRQYNWLKGSADNSIGGASSKKLTGFFCMILVAFVVFIWAIWAYKNKDWAMMPIVLPTLVGAGLGALGINSNEKIKLGQKKDENG